MTVEERLARLERKSRRQSAMILLLLASIVGLSYVAVRLQRVRRSSTLTAQRIVLLDAQGRERVGLSAQGGQAALMLHDEQGRVRASLDVRAGGPGLTFLDEKGRVRFLASLHPSGPFVGLTDERGEDLARLPKSP
jgi:hypothetical protein